MSIHQRIKAIREKYSLNQEDFATSIGLKRGNYAMLEIGKQLPTLPTLSEIVKKYDTTYEWLIEGLSENLTTVVAESDTNYLKGKNIRILPIHVTEKNKENIILVPIKAIAGYVSGGFQDKEFVGKLPSFNLVGYTGNTFRAFEIKGESMYPTYYEKDVVICKYVEDWVNFKNDKSYIIHTNDGLVCKRIINKIEKHQLVILTSDNSEFEPYPVFAIDIREIWEIQSFIRIAPPKKKHLDSDDLLSSIRNLESAIKSIKKG